MWRTGLAAGRRRRGAAPSARGRRRDVPPSSALYLLPLDPRGRSRRCQSKVSSDSEKFTGHLPDASATGGVLLQEAESSAGSVKPSRAESSEAPCFTISTQCCFGSCSQREAATEMLMAATTAPDTSLTGAAAHLTLGVDSWIPKAMPRSSTWSRSLSSSASVLMLRSVRAGRLRDLETAGRAAAEKHRPAVPCRAR